MGTDATARVRAALAATPPEYLTSCLKMRSALGGDGCGSIYDLLPGEIREYLATANWDDVPAWDGTLVKEPAHAFVSCIEGSMGIVNLDQLGEDDVVILEDPKGTGYASCTYRVENPVEYVQFSPFTTMILGPGDDGAEIVWTFHPGPPLPPSTLRVQDVSTGVPAIVTVATARKLGFDFAKIAKL